MPAGFEAEDSLKRIDDEAEGVVSVFWNIVVTRWLNFTTKFDAMTFGYLRSIWNSSAEGNDHRIRVNPVFRKMDQKRALMFHKITKWGAR